MNSNIANNINKIKSALGQYEKLLFDTEVIRNTCVSQSVKNMIYKELQLECDEWKRKLIEFISELPNIVNTNIPNNTASAEETVQKMNLEQEVSIIEKTPEQKWKEGFSEKIHAIYDRNLKYIETKEVFKEIYEYMTNSYGIVWEQDFKEWRRTNDGVPRTLDIIFNNAQYKSIFDAVLQDKYSEAIESNPVSIKEIIEPLANKSQDKSKGYCSTLKKIYTYMSETYNIDWDKHKRKYFKEKGSLPKAKSDLLYFNHGLIEKFRMSVNYFTEK